MSDFFADLRRDLMEAAGRESRTPFLLRLRMPWRPVFAVAGAAAAAALVLSVAASLSTEVERDVGPATSGVVEEKKVLAGTCAASRPAPEIVETFGIFRRERTAGDELERGLHAVGALVHSDESRRAAELDDGAVYLVPSLSCKSGDPAVCVATVRKEKGSALACEHIKATMLGAAALDGEYLSKAVPDHVERVRYTDGTTSGTVDVANNLFLASVPRNFALEKLVLKFQLKGKDGFDVAPLGVERADGPSEKGANESVEPAKEPGLQECGAPPPPPTEGSVPESLRSAFRVLRDRDTSTPVPQTVDRWSPQVVRNYEDGASLSRTVDGQTLWVSAAEIQPHSMRKLGSERARRGQRCARAVEGPGQPGLCLHSATAKGGIVACYLPEEIRAGKAYYDTTKLHMPRVTIVGLAPDGASTAVVQVGGRTRTFAVERNTFAGEVDVEPGFDPEARISFR